MVTIHAIRHAQASFGHKDYDRLSALGFEQADLLADHLASLGIDFLSVFLGRHQRHAQTFEPFEKKMILAGVKPRIQKSAAFNEFDYEMVLRTAIPELIKKDPKLAKDVDVMLDDNRIFQRIFEKSVLMWLEKPAYFPKLGSWPSFSRSVRTEIDRMMEAAGLGKNPVIFTSGGVIAAMIQAALYLSDKETLKLSWRICNGSINRFNYQDGKLILLGFNDIAYLRVLPEKRLMTYR